MDKSLPRGKIRKVTGLMKDRLSQKIRQRFGALKPKINSCLAYPSVDKKAKDKKKCVIKLRLQLNITKSI